MPYDPLSGLPDSVRNGLPEHAPSAYADAWGECADGDRRDPDGSRPTAHPAWGAVEQQDEGRGDRRTQTS